MWIFVYENFVCLHPLLKDLNLIIEVLTTTIALEQYWCEVLLRAVIKSQALTLRSCTEKRPHGIILISECQAAYQTQANYINTGICEESWPYQIPNVASFLRLFLSLLHRNIYLSLRHAQYWIDHRFLFCRNLYKALINGIKVNLLRATNEQFCNLKVECLLKSHSWS